jgi:hypothetical protein
LRQSGQEAEGLLQKRKRRSEDEKRISNVVVKYHSYLRDCGPGMCQGDFVKELLLLLPSV